MKPVKRICLTTKDGDNLRKQLESQGWVVHSFTYSYDSNGIVCSLSAELWHER